MRRTLRAALALIVGLLLAPVSASAQISFDATSNSSAVTPASGVVTFSATVNTGGFLTVVAHARDDTVSSVTFNGSALTSRVSKTSVDSLHVSIWTLSSPSVGTFNVVVTCATAAPTYCAGTAISLLGVDGASPVDATSTVETTGANPSFSTFTTVTNGAAVIDGVSTNEGTLAITMNAETNRVQRANYTAPAQLRSVAASTIITKSPAGSVTMGWNVNTNNSAYAGLALKPAAAGGATTPRLLLLGVGGTE